MTSEWSLPVWAVLVSLGGVLIVLVVLILLVRATAARAAQAGELARAESEDLRVQLQLIEQRLGSLAPTSVGVDVEQHEYVITRLGDPAHDEPREVAAVVDAPLFADLVLREGVVQAASFAAGLRRALSPEHLNRVRFEMRREVKRARKQRRVELRLARRDLHARERTGEAAA